MLSLPEKVQASIPIHRGAKEHLRQLLKTRPAHLAQTLEILGTLSFEQQSNFLQALLPRHYPLTKLIKAYPELEVSPLNTLAQVHQKGLLKSTELGMALQTLLEVVNKKIKALSTKLSQEELAELKQTETELAKVAIGFLKGELTKGDLRIQMQGLLNAEHFMKRMDQHRNWHLPFQATATNKAIQEFKKALSKEEQAIPLPKNAQQLDALLQQPSDSLGQTLAELAKLPSWYQYQMCRGLSQKWPLIQILQFNSHPENPIAVLSQAYDNGLLKDNEFGKKLFGLLKTMERKKNKLYQIEDAYYDESMLRMDYKLRHNGEITVLMTSIEKLCEAAVGFLTGDKTELETAKIVSELLKESSCAINLHRHQSPKYWFACDTTTRKEVERFKDDLKNLRGEDELEPPQNSGPA